MNDGMKAIMAKNYAEHVRDVAMSKLLQEQELAHLYQQMEPKGIRYGDKVSVSPTAETIPNGVAKISELAAIYETQLEEYVAAINEMHNVLLNLDAISRSALTQHYIMLMTWEEVCVDMGYTYDGIMKVRRRGLVKLYDFMPGEWRNIPKALEDRDFTLTDDGEDMAVYVNGEPL